MAWIVVMVSRVYTYLHTYEVVYNKNAQLFVCHSYLNKGVFYFFYFFIF